MGSHLGRDVRAPPSANCGSTFLWAQATASTKAEEWTLACGLGLAWGQEHQQIEGEELA